MTSLHDLNRINKSTAEIFQDLRGNGNNQDLWRTMDSVANGFNIILQHLTDQKADHKERAGNNNIYSLYDLKKVVEHTYDTVSEFNQNYKKMLESYFGSTANVTKAYIKVIHIITSNLEDMLNFLEYENTKKGD